MKKIKIEELGCFNEVASVIGVAEAKRELFIAAMSGCINTPEAKHLGGAFRWSKSPQGLGFWAGVDDKITHR